LNNKHVRTLLEKLNDYCARALENAAAFASTRTHYEVTLDHFVIKLMEEGGSDLDRVLSHFDIDQDQLWQDILEHMATFNANNQGKPGFSPVLFQWLEKAYIASTLHYNQNQIRSIALLDALVEMSPTLPGSAYQILDNIPLDTLRKNYESIIDGSVEAETYSPPVLKMPATASKKANKQETNMKSGGPKPAPSDDQAGDSALARFTEDVTAKAAEGRIDPVLGRDDEIRLMIDILSRRRKNNPILVGEPGVGKTALVEGLAIRIAEDTVPDNLKKIRLHTLDLGLLQAGAGVKGEFEKRLKAVIDEVKNSSTPIIMFIDEAHTLIGAGGQAGMSDAANLLKPALARGELRTIAATTWSEYKQYFERDAALERRFQLVKVEEPSIDKAILMLNGLKDKYQAHHNILITDEAIDSAVKLSSRYINGRYLPDKAIDLLDTAAARIRMGQAAKPASIESADSHINYIEKRLKQLDDERKDGLFVDQRLIAKLNDDLQETIKCRDDEISRWEQETQLVNHIHEKRNELKEHYAAEKPNKKAIEKSLSESKKARVSLVDVQGQEPLVQAEVNGAAIAKIISDWTGIPVGNMQKDDANALIAFEDRIGCRVVGQDMAIASIGRAIRSARAGLSNPEAPLGVFLLTGPSGVGKTETARAIAEELYGGERFLITINMSEYQEAHTVSQLKGSPPGYVGYGEGGVLTEAVRQRPYSVVLLDEVEKAHPDVMNLFYQVFDRGFMRDGEGREIDFKNTIILMTSNLASAEITELTQPPVKEMDMTELSGEAGEEAMADSSQTAESAEDKWEMPGIGTIRESIQPILLRHFQPALLGRMQVVPFVSLDQDALKNIVALKLDAVAQRLKDSHDIEFRCTPDILDYLADRCNQTETGARYINSIIEQQLLPEIARSILAYMMEDDMPDILTLELDENDEMSLVFADRQPEPVQQSAKIEAEAIA
jgi:type VI secretion system protein VasG